MSAGIGHEEHKLTIVLIPYEQPVGLDVTFPKAFVFAVKDMRVILLRQTSFFSKNVKHISQQLFFVSSFKASFQRTTEFTGELKRVFHPLHCLIRSSTLLAS